MLMANFKSASDLGITEPQKEALMKTLVLLETGKLTHVPDPIESPEYIIPFEERQFSGEFNMSSWSKSHHCGTVCCIGGTAELVGSLPVYSLDPSCASNAGLHNLFYPQVGGYNQITPAQAARALRSYLTTSDAKWHEACA
jgi:hypothetical protein